MYTIKSILESKRLGYQQKAAMETLKVGSGLEDALVFQTSGAPWSNRLYSNRVKTLKAIDEAGFKVVAEAVGAKKRYRSEGRVIYFAVVNNR